MSQYWHCYYLKSALEMMPLVFNWSPFPALGPHLRCQSNGIFSHHVSSGSSWPWPLLSFSLFLRTWTVMRSNAQVFHRMPLNWDLSDLFLVIRLGLWIYGGCGGSGGQERQVHFHPMVWRVRTINISCVSGSLTSWLRSCLLGFSTVNLLYSLPLSILYSLVHKRKAEKKHTMSI